MKSLKYIIVLIAFVFSYSAIYAQNENGEAKEKKWYEKGKIYGKVYANYHTSGTELGKQNAFEVNRAYFGYQTNLDKHFSANVKLDIGASEDLGRRIAFFKNAYLQYKYESFKVQFGIADAFQFKVQEKFWGYRYIYKSFQDENKFGSSADIGIFMSYKFNDMVSVDYSINNGDGYGKVQNTETDNLKNSFGVTFHPIKLLTLRAYADVMSISDSAQATGVFFAGLKFERFRFGGEYVYQMNHKLEKDNNYNGFSVMTAFNILDNLSVFARYDYLTSDKTEAAEDDNGNPILDSNGGQVYNPWNEANDGNFIIGGIEFNPIKKVNLSLNYRHEIFTDNKIEDKASIYLNVQVAF